jgi:hypothetical protein
MLSVVDQDGGTITHNVKGKGGFAFDGFTSFALSKDAKTYHGLTPHVTENGFCNDGCFNFGNQDIESGEFTGFGPLPFKSVMSDTRFFHEAAGVYYTQGSYPLTKAASCSSDETDACMFAVNASTGEFLEFNSSYGPLPASHTHDS